MQFVHHFLILIQNLHEILAQNASHCRKLMQIRFKKGAGTKMHNDLYSWVLIDLTTYKVTQLLHLTRFKAYHRREINKKYTSQSV